MLVAVSFFVDSVCYSISSSEERTLRPRLLTEKASIGTKNNSNISWDRGRREFIINLTLAMAAVAGGVSAGVGYSFNKRIHPFRFDTSNIERQQEEYDFETRSLINELVLLKTKKMPHNKILQYCENIKGRLVEKEDENMKVYDKIAYDKATEVILPYLLNFLTDEDVNGLDSVSVKWGINLVKEDIMKFLFEMLIMDTTVPIDIMSLIVETIGKCLEYEDNFRGEDVLFQKYFPNIDPEDVLNFSIRQRAEFDLEQIRADFHSNPIQNLALQQSSVRKPAERSMATDMVYRFFLLNGTPLYIEESLSMIRKRETEDVHYVSEEDRDVIKELQRLPKKIRKYCLESAAAHNLPPRLLVGTIIFNSSRRNYGIESGIRILRKRGGVDDSTQKFLHKIARYMPNKMGSAELKDAIGGIIFDGKTTIGITQIRPAWVRRYRAWERFGIDAGKLSNREIAWKLLDDKYAIEAAAKMWSCLIEETKEARESAINFNREINMKDYGKEVGSSYLYHMVPVEGYKYLPNSSIFGKEDWIITPFHPVYCDWPEVKSQLRWQELIQESGILDNKPVRFIGSDKDLDIQTRRQFLLGITGSI